MYLPISDSAIFLHLSRSIERYSCLVILPFTSPEALFLHYSILSHRVPQAANNPSKYHHHGQDHVRPFVFYHDSNALPLCQILPLLPAPSRTSPCNSQSMRLPIPALAAIVTTAAVLAIYVTYFLCRRYPLFCYQRKQARPPLPLTFIRRSSQPLNGAPASPRTLTSSQKVGSRKVERAGKYPMSLHEQDIINGRSRQPQNHGGPYSSTELIASEHHAMEDKHPTGLPGVSNLFRVCTGRSANAPEVTVTSPSSLDLVPPAAVSHHRSLTTNARSKELSNGRAFTGATQVRSASSSASHTSMTSVPKSFPTRMEEDKYHASQPIISAAPSAVELSALPPSPKISENPFFTETPTAPLPEDAIERIATASATNTTRLPYPCNTSLVTGATLSTTSIDNFRTTQISPSPLQNPQQEMPPSSSC